MPVSILCIGTSSVAMRCTASWIARSRSRTGNDLDNRFGSIARPPISHGQDQRDHIGQSLLGRILDVRQGEIAGDRDRHRVAGRSTSRIASRSSLDKVQHRRLMARKTPASAGRTGPSLPDKAVLDRRIGPADRHDIDLFALRVSGVRIELPVTGQLDISVMVDRLSCRGAV